MPQNKAAVDEYYKQLDVASKFKLCLKENLMDFRNGLTIVLLCYGILLAL